MLYVPVVIFGLILGSFLNVCIYRIPRELSIVRPSSRCPSCGTPIKIYDNIPVLSYLILGGRCRHCNTGFSVRYPLIELLNAVLYAIVFSRFGTAAPWVLLVYMLFTSPLIVILFIDLEHQIIPDRITLPGIPIAIILGSTVLPDPFMRTELLGLKSIYLEAGSGASHTVEPGIVSAIRKTISLPLIVGGVEDLVSDHHRGDDDQPDDNGLQVRVHERAPRLCFGNAGTSRCGPSPFVATLGNGQYP